MKQIKVNLCKYLEAPIDDKNVMSDSIIESLFDDGNYVWDRNEAVGFISGYPSYACYSGNRLKIKRFSSDTFEGWEDWAKSIIERVTGSEFKEKIKCNNDKGYFNVNLLDNETNKEYKELQLITSFFAFRSIVCADFYWNQKE